MKKLNFLINLKNKIRFEQESIQLLYFALPTILVTIAVVWYFIFIIQGELLSPVAISFMAAGDTMLIFLPFIFFRPKMKYVLFIPTIFISFWCLAELIYYRNFGDLIPGASLLLFSSVLDETVLKSTFSSFSFKDIIFLFPILILVASIIFVRIKRIQILSTRKLSKGIFAILTVLIILLSFFFSYRRTYLNNASNDKTTLQILGKKWRGELSLKDYIYDFGFFGSVVRTVIEALAPSPELMENDYKNIFAFIEKTQKDEPDFIEFKNNKSKNLIFIVVESLNSTVLDVNKDLSITPVLDSLINLEGTIFIRKICSKTFGGRSSDAQFMYNTGLYPLRDEPLIVRYNTAPYPSLVKALKRQKAIEVIGEDKSLWRHKSTSVSYGYDELYDKSATDGGDDGDIFLRAEGLIKYLPQPFMAFITTISMHDPYDKPKVKELVDKEKLKKEYPDLRDRNYLQRVKYLDTQIGNFLNFLAENDIDKNSIIVIISDHDVRYGTISEALRTREIPMIILNTGITKKIDEPRRHIDVFPTILDVMDIYDYIPSGMTKTYRGLGKSILRQEPDSEYYDEGERISEKMVKGRFFHY